MAKCTDCLHYGVCSGFTPTDLDEDVWDYCKKGIPEEIPDIEKRCDGFKEGKSWAEVVRCKDCKDHDRCEVEDLLRYFDPTSEPYCSVGERKDYDNRTEL